MKMISMFVLSPGQDPGRAGLSMEYKIYRVITWQLDDIDLNKNLSLSSTGKLYHKSQAVQSHVVEILAVFPVVYRIEGLG